MWILQKEEERCQAHEKGNTESFIWIFNCVTVTISVTKLTKVKHNWISIQNIFRSKTLSAYKEVLQSWEETITITGVLLLTALASIWWLWSNKIRLGLVVQQLRFFFQMKMNILQQGEKANGLKNLRMVGVKKISQVSSMNINYGKVK